MNKTEIEILKAVRKNLYDSTQVSWDYGYLDAWASWAKKMRTSIANSIGIIDALAVETPDLDKLSDSSIQPDTTSSKGTT